MTGTIRMARSVTMLNAPLNTRFAIESRQWPSTASFHDFAIGVHAKIRTKVFVV